MRKIIIIVTFLYLTSTVIDSSIIDSHINYLRYNQDRNLFQLVETIEINNGESQYSILTKIIYPRLENEFDVSISDDMIKLADNKGNLMIGLSIDIHAKKQIEEYFRGHGHRSILIESTILNILQPFINDWQFKYIVIQIDGIYVDKLGTDREYCPIVSRSGIDISDDYIDYSTFPDNGK